MPSWRAHEALVVRDALQMENKWLAAQLEDARSETEKLHSDLLKAREWSNVTPLQQPEERSLCC